MKFKKEPTLSGKMLALSINEIKKWNEEMQISLQLYITEHNLSEYIILHDKHGEYGTLDGERMLSVNNTI